MPKGSETIYAKSRCRAGLVVEEAVELLSVCSPRQFSRYESVSEKTQPPAEVVARMVEVYDDMHLGYIYLRKNPVAQMFIPGGVERMSLLEAGTAVFLEFDKLMEDKEAILLLQMVRDNKITEDEEETYQRLKAKFMKLHRALIALECADGVKR